MRNRAILLAAVLSTILVAGTPWAIAQCQDNDFDGYCSVATGGSDCQDLTSAYKENATGACRENQSSTYLIAPALPQSSQAIHDHSWINAGGKYHLFAHSVDHDARGYAGSIRHFVSNDLLTLQSASHPIAISSTPGSWDKDSQWAPHVVFNDGTYYMFYVGVDFGDSGNPADHRYAIGVARSRDLQNWAKEPNPVYDCSADWVERNNTYSYRCRDPFVMYDEANCRWLLFATELLKTGVTPGPLSEGIVVAQAPHLLGPWTSLGYVKATKTLDVGDGGVGGQLPCGSTLAVSENPFITSFNGLHYLFFKDWKDEQNCPGRTMIQYATSPALSFDENGSPDWAYRGYTPDPGVSAAEIITLDNDTWIMTPYVSNLNAGPDSYPAYWNQLRLKRIVWDGAGGFTTKKLTRLTCRLPSAEIHPDATEACNDAIDQDCNPATSGCSGGSHDDPTQQ